MALIRWNKVVVVVWTMSFRLGFINRARQEKGSPDGKKLQWTRRTRSREKLGGGHDAAGPAG